MSLSIANLLSSMMWRLLEENRDTFRVHDMNEFVPRLLSGCERVIPVGNLVFQAGDFHSPSVTSPRAENFHKDGYAVVCVMAGKL
ncbi:hypothetical protein [Rhizobium wenxiniae]|uniref:hypothetical protein n=1 Tax=Rhizobium wenxiniae TaxID=1737357 RepID=UPI001C6EFF13|nr:hypothetical protein [Rhizobium wenxiniae]